MSDKKVLAGVAEVVQAIYDEAGEVRPSDLVERARPKDSPAHAAFEWRDRVAGDSWRLHQARGYLRRIRITYEDQPTQLFHTPKVRENDGEPLFERSREGTYKPAGQMIHHVDEYQAAVNELQGKIASMRRSLDHLLEVARQQPQGDDRSAIVAQLARFMDMMEHALTRH